MDLVMEMQTVDKAANVSDMPLIDAQPEAGEPQKRNPAWFNATKAREMAAKSAQVRRERAAQPKPEKPEVPRAAEEPKAAPLEQDTYRQTRLARVRAQLDRIDAMMMKERDPQKLDRLASAQIRLSEQERKLSGRPDPGSFRPAAPRRNKSDVDLSPM